MKTTTKISKIESALTAMLLSSNSSRVADAAAIQNFKLIPTLRVPTAATDGIVIIYNPIFIDGLTIEEIQGLLIHELCHIVFAHNERFLESGWLDHDRANKSMDREINPVVLSAGYKLPSGGLMPADINMANGLAWEEYYANEVSSQPDGATGESDQVADGVHETGELAKEFDAESAEYSDAELQAMADDLRQAAEDAIDGSQLGQKLTQQSNPNAKAGRSTECGELTGGEVLLAGSTRWQDVVIDLIGNRLGGQSRADWSRPLRRSASAGAFLPSRRRDNGIKLALVLDVSGSCVGFFKHWQAMAREMVEAIPEITKLEILYHDTEVKNRTEWNRRDGIEIEIASRGGGGTCHREVLAECEDMDIDGIVMFTDSESSWPNEQPSVECVTVQPPGSYSKTPFGTNIRIEKW